MIWNIYRKSPLCCTGNKAAVGGKENSAWTLLFCEQKPYIVVCVCVCVCVCLCVRKGMDTITLRVQMKSCHFWSKGTGKQLLTPGKRAGINAGFRSNPEKGWDH